MTKQEQTEKMMTLSTIISSRDDWSNNWSAENNWSTSFKKTLNGVDYGFFIRLDEYKERLELSALTLRSKLDTSWYETPVIKTVGIDFKKPIETIIKDINNRFLTAKNLSLMNESVDKINENDAYLTNKLNKMKQAAEILGLSGYNNMTRSETLTGFYNKDSNKSFLKVEDYCDGFRITMDNISVNQLKMIQMVLK